MFSFLTQFFWRENCAQSIELMESRTQAIREFKIWGRQRQQQRQRHKPMIWLVEWGKIIVLHVQRIWLVEWGKIIVLHVQRIWLVEWGKIIVLHLQRPFWCNFLMWSVKRQRKVFIFEVLTITQARSRNSFILCLTSKRNYTSPRLYNLTDLE